MKKEIKNIIMICILFLMLGLTYLTINYAKNNISANNNNMAPIKVVGISYSSIQEITEDEDITNEEFNSKDADGNAIMISN